MTGGFWLPGLCADKPLKYAFEFVKDEPGGVYDLCVSRTRSDKIAVSGVRIETMKVQERKKVVTAPPKKRPSRSPEKTLTEQEQRVEDMLKETLAPETLQDLDAL